MDAAVSEGMAEEQVHGVNGAGSLQYDESAGRVDMHRSVVHRCRGKVRVYARVALGIIGTERGPTKGCISS